MNASHAQQRALIRSFYKEFFSYKGQIPWLVPSLYSIGFLAMLCLPDFQNMERASLLLIMMIQINMQTFIVMPYQYTPWKHENKKSQNLFKLLCSLPVSKTQLWMEILLVAWRFCRRLTLIALVIQTITSLITNNFQWINFLAVVILGLVVVPLINGVIMIFNLARY